MGKYIFTEKLRLRQDLDMVWYGMGVCDGKLKANIAGEKIN